jgi:hypothetical protein
MPPADCSPCRTLRQSPLYAVVDASIVADARKSAALNESFVGAVKLVREVSVAAPN